MKQKCYTLPQTLTQQAPTLIDELYPLAQHTRFEAAQENGIEVRLGADFLDFIRGKDCIRISLAHLIYGRDVIRDFDCMYNAVEPYHKHDLNIVDFSTPRFHQIKGYPLHPVYFASFVELFETVEQYLQLANLKQGQTVLDLGAYSGLTSILFKREVGAQGRVIAVEPDKHNIETVKINFNLFKNITNLNIELIEAAIWEHNDGLEFSSEGNMGSSAAQIVGSHRSHTHKVPSLTLLHLAQTHNLEKIDFIKCDIEGAESVIFNPPEFFELYRPKILVEAHNIKGISTEQTCIEKLQSYSYTCKPIIQKGVPLPLIECTPN